MSSSRPENSNSTTSIHSALALHVARFADKDMNYCPASVAAGLDKIHGSQTTLKGAVISTFNATHSESVVCPHTGAHFVKDKNGYGRTLHMGTTRIWNADGSINESRWDKFNNAVAERVAGCDEDVMRYSKLRAYLDVCYANDPQDTATGRNTSSLFSSKYMQGTAAVKGWDEVYDRLTCGWVEKTDGSGDLEPYIKMSLVREFFVNSVTAFQKAEDGLLPVAKPAVAAELKPSL